MTAAEIATLLTVFAKAADHHDEAKPEVEHNLDVLAQEAAGTAPRGGLTAVFKALLENPAIVAAILGGLATLLQNLRKPKPAEAAPAAPPANRPDSRPDIAPEPAEKPALESWEEESWADAYTRYPDQAELDAEGKPSDWAASGTPIHNDIFVTGSKGTPSNVVIRFMTGTLPQPSTVPTDGTAPFAVKHVFDVDGTVYELPSTTNIDGGENPIAEFGHPSGGPRWQKSAGWDVTVRVKPNPKAERKVTYHTEAVDGVSATSSEPKTFRIAKGK